MSDLGPALIVPTLMSRRLTLEPLSRAHSEGMFALWSHPEVSRYSGAALDLEGRAIALPTQGPSDSDKIIDFFVRGAAAGTRFRWALLTKAEGQFVGAMGFNVLGVCSEYAYHLRPEFWNRGLATEASRTAIRWLRSRPGCVRVEAFIEPANTASIKLARRLGFRATGEVLDGADRYAMSLKQLRK